ncbi:MAG: histidinol dehydrogenase [Candidatus Latescibacterota bacterium]|jgi:histidinol dehydrogenase
MKIVEYTQEILEKFSRQNESAFDPEIQKKVETIISDVRENGDAAVMEYTGRFDGVTLPAVECVSRSELLDLHSRVDVHFLHALREAIDNVRRFHEKQVRESYWIDGEDGVRLGMRYTPLDSVGLYVPGGAAAYPSTIVMNAVPAQVAGVRRIAAVTPPARFQENPHVAAAFVELGIEEIYTIGGVQAIAALAYGTQTIPRVDKIVGPGNMYVALAKKLVFGTVDIDMVAGPSEIVIVAEEKADPAFVAADLLSQAEHGSGMEKIILLTPSRTLAEAVITELYSQVENLSRAKDIKKVLDGNDVIIVRNLDEAVEAVNEIAPEHLELMVKEPYVLLEKVKNAGAVFLGDYSPEPVSDYFAGPNHVLPTSGSARYASPLGVYDFQKCMNVVEYTREAIMRNGLKIDRLARAEGFDAHARAVTIRMKSE